MTTADLDLKNMEKNFGKWYGYKKLTDICAMKYCTGKNKINQLKELENIVLLERYGSKIKMIRWLTQEEIDNKRELKYQIDYLRVLLYTSLYNASDKRIIARMPQLMKELNFVNGNYNIAKNNQLDFTKALYEKDKIETNIDTLQDFFITTQEMFRTKIMSLLEDMRKRLLIEYTRVYTLGFIRNNYTEFKLLDSVDERAESLEIERIALKKFGYESWEDIKGSDSYYRYIDVNKEIGRIFNKKYQNHFFCFSFDIIINKDGIKDYLTDDFYGLSKQFNKLIKEKMLESKDKRLNNDGIEDYTNWFIDTKPNLLLKLDKGMLKIK